MSKTSQELPKFRFLTTFILPALLVFLVPVFSYFFFHHAENRFDANLRDSILNQIRDDRKLSPEQRKDAIAFFTQVPVSQLLQSPEFAENTPTETRFHYATFRWMIWL